MEQSILTNPTITNFFVGNNENNCFSTKNINPTFAGQSLEKVTKDFSIVGFDIPIYILQRFEKILKLEKNWDGYGAETISKKIVENCKTILKKIPSQYLTPSFLHEDDITPTPHGTITLDWINGKDEIISVEVGTTGIGYFTDLQTKDKGIFEIVEKSSIEETIPKILKILKILY